MAYKAPIWEDGRSPAISAENLNALSQAAEGAQVLYGNSAPTSSTKGAVGQFYLVVVADGYGNYPLYQCIAIANGSYTWKNMAIVPAKVAAAFNLPTGSVVSDVLLAAAAPRLISSYEVAGSYQWTAPDLIDGKPYKIGVLIIGGGGGGGVNAYSSEDYSGSTNGYGLGGASGYSKHLTAVVTPGVTKNLVVGKGGVSASSWNISGGGGGTSSFDGVVVAGGGGGSHQSDSSNAQRSRGARGNGAGEDGEFGLEKMRGFSTYLSAEAPWQCVNLFEGKEILGSGGCATVYEDSGRIEAHPGGKGPDGLGGGDAGATGGEDATAPGCGGGGTVDGYTSGAGADGAVYIYFLGVAE